MPALLIKMSIRSTCFDTSAADHLRIRNTRRNLSGSYRGYFCGFGDIEGDENHVIAMLCLNLLQLSGRRGISASGNQFPAALCKVFHL